MSNLIDNVDDNTIFDGLTKKLESLIDGKDNTISKLAENLSIQHKKILKQNNKIFELLKKLSELKICPADLSIKLGCVKDPLLGIKKETILNCWKEWVNG